MDKYSRTHDHWYSDWELVLARSIRREEEENAKTEEIEQRGDPSRTGKTALRYRRVFGWGRDN